MLKARKANRVIRIPDEKKDAYVALGYKVTDMEDHVIAEPHNAEKEVEALKEQVSDLGGRLKEASQYALDADKKIEALTAENATLKAQVSDLEGKLKEAAQKKQETKPAGGSTEAGKQATSDKQATK